MHFAILIKWYWSRVRVLKGLAYLLVVLFVLVVAFVIGSQNEAYISVNYLIAKSDMRISTLIAIALGVGIVLGCLIMMTSWLGMRLQVSRLKMRIRRMSKEA